MEKTITIQVSGRVQGVFFRKYVLQKAQELGIKGFVKNIKNGDVFIKASGNESELQKLIAYCKQGPPASQVKKIATEEVPYELFQQFAIEKG